MTVCTSCFPSLVLSCNSPSTPFTQVSTEGKNIGIRAESQKTIYLYPFPVLRTACTNTPLLATAVYTDLTFNKQNRHLSDGGYGSLIIKNKIYMRMKEYENKNMTTHTRRIKDHNRIPQGCWNQLWGLKIKNYFSFSPQGSIRH